jgi:diaminopropionate ammonia-lyase family
MAATLRRPIYLNYSAKAWRAPESTSAQLVSAFHRRIPEYSPTRLISLNQLAEEIGVKVVYLKDEGQRFGLPAFKILGASWGTFRAITAKLGLPLDSSLDAVKAASSAKPTTLLAATDGNHGRAVARMGTILAMRVQIFVPSGMSPSSLQAIKGEGALVTQVDGSYDLAVRVAFDATERSHEAILVQDTAFLGYEEIPNVSLRCYNNSVTRSCRTYSSGSWKAMAP